MSGGAYSYAYRALEDFADALDALNIEGACYSAPLPVRAAFVDHCRKVAAAMKAIEWNDSYDGDPDEEKLIRACLERKRSPKKTEAE